MKIGFLVGMIFATWLTLNYPQEMAVALTKGHSIASDTYNAFNK